MIAVSVHPGDARAFWRMAEPESPALAWLGQAGFALRWRKLRLVIDPYLSNHLEKKYRGTDRPHDRLMPAPITPEELPALDYVICTHRHSDHMDPETLPLLAFMHSACRFVLPRAALPDAVRLGLPQARVIPVDAGEPIPLAADASLLPLPAAHETLEKDAAGHHLFLGYILKLGAGAVYHSGDSVPYTGLEQLLSGAGIGLALLPVNGRGKGVAGNFDFAEAVALCCAAGIPHMVPHHFGMFAFNSVDRDELERLAHETVSPLCHVPDTGHWLQLDF